MLRDRGVRARSFAGGTSLRDFIDMAAACRVFLTNDSGAMHIASAAGVPTLAVSARPITSQPALRAPSRVWCGSPLNAAPAFSASAPSITAA